MAETTKKQRFEVGTRFVGNVNYVPMEVIGIHDPWKGCQYEGVFKPAPRAVIRNLLTGNTSTQETAMSVRWIAFMYDGKEIFAYTIKGTFPGEMQATKELLAAERGISPEEITIKLR